MIESTKAVTDTDNGPEVLAHYTKALPKGRRDCHHRLKTELSVEIERTPEEWIASIESRVLV